MLEPNPEIEAAVIKHKKGRMLVRPIPSVCDECSEPFDSKTQLNEHIRQKHPREPAFNDTKRDEFLELLKRGVRFFAACKSVGISPATVKRAQKVDPTFDEAVELAEEEAAERAEVLLWEQAESGNMTAIVKILDKRQAKRWATEQKITVNHTGQVTHRAELMPHQNKMEELRARARERMALKGAEETSELDEIIDAEIVE